MNTPGLVASDLDGTLLHTDGEVGAATVDMLDRLADKGIPFVMVTGRPIRWLGVVLEQTGMRGLAVCSNGAVVYDPVAGEVLEWRPLAVDLLSEVTRRLRAEYPGAVFAAETGGGLRHEPGYQVWDDPTIPPPCGLPDVVAEPAVKLLARIDGEVPAELTDLVARSLSGMVEVTRSTEHGLLEISAAGITKATGLAWVAERLGVPAADIVAFGDMPNDLPMFAYVGHSVAMANAEPAVRDAADAVTTATNDEDGVATYLAGLLA